MKFVKLSYRIPHSTAVILAIGISSLLITSADELHAQSTYTTNATDLWSNAAKWDVFPSSDPSTSLIFSITTTSTISLSQDISDPFVLNKLAVIATNTGTVNFNGGDLIFTGADAALSSNVSSTKAIVVGNNVVIGGSALAILSQSAGTGTAGSALIVTGNVSTTNTGLTTLTLGGGATSSANRIAGIISDGISGGQTAIFKTGAGSWTVSNNANSFSGGITIEQGALFYDGLSDLGDQAATITMGNSSNLSSSLGYLGTASITFTRDVHLGGTGIATFGANSSSSLALSVTYSNTLVFDDSNFKRVRLVAASTGTNAIHDFQTYLTNPVGTTLGLYKSGNGTWLVSNTANDFTGGITIQAGHLRYTDSNALNLMNNNLTFTGIPATGTGSTLQTSGSLVNSLGNGAGQFQFLGSGGFAAVGGDLNVTLNNDAATAIEWGGPTGATRLGAVVELNLSATNANGVTYFHNALELTGSTNATRTHRINVADNVLSNSEHAVMTGVLSGSGGITKTGTGLLKLTGENVFTGGITIYAGIVEGNSVTNLNLPAQALRFSGTNNGTAGVIQTSGTLTFAGVGTDANQVSWLNNLSGGFAAFGGDLTVSITTSATPVWGTGGFLQGAGNELVLSSTSADSKVDWTSDIDLGNATRTIRILDHGVFSLTSDYAVISGNISNGGITKTGRGLLELSGANTFSLGLRIGAGVVRALDPGANLNINDSIEGNFVRFQGIHQNIPVLEGSGTLTNALGIGPGQIQWGPIGAINATTAASGGFSAYNGTFDITLDNGGSPLAWASTAGFVDQGAQLIFGSIYANNVVTFHNDIDLNGATRVIRTIDNPDSDTDFGVIAGVISDPLGTGALSLTGTGRLVLANDNTYSGITANPAGSTLQLGNYGVGGSVAGSISNTGTLVFSYGAGTVRNVATIVSGTGTTVIDSDPTGGVQFDVAQTYTGFTTIESGTLRYGLATALPVSSRIRISTTGILDVNGFAVGINNLLDGDGGGVITNQGASASVLSLTQGNFSGVIQDGIGGIGILKTSTTGTLVLSGANTFSGNSVLTQAGRIVIGHDSALGLAAWTISDTRSSIAGDGTPRTVSNFFTLSGATTITGDSDLTFSGEILQNAGNRTLTVRNTGVTTFENIRISEGTGSGGNRNLSIWSADYSDVVIKNVTNTTNTGTLTLTGNLAGEPGAKFTLDGTIDVRVVTIGGIGRDIEAINSSVLLPRSGGLLNFVNTGHTFTLGAAATMTNGSIRVNTNADTNIHILGTMGNGTISLSGGNAKLVIHNGGVVGNGAVVVTGAGSQVIVQNGGSLGGGAITIDNDTILDIQAGATVGNGTITALNAATIHLNGTKGTGNISLDNGSILTGNGGSSLGTLIMSVGSNLYVGGLGATGTLGFGGLTINGGTLRFDVGTLSDQLISAGIPDITGPATINIAAGDGFGVGDYTLISGFGGTITGGSLANLNIVAPAGFKKSLDNTVSGSLILRITEAVTRTWDGAINGVWDDAVTANFSGQSYTNFDNDAVFFGDGPTNSNITIDGGGGGLEPTSILINNSATTYTFSGDPIIGTAGLVKQGPGTAVFLNDNTFTGGIQIAGGAVQLGNGGSTGQFDTNSIVALNNGATLVVDRSNLLTLNGNIAGTGNVMMNGTGTLQLAGINSFVGNLTVNAGAVELIGAGQLNEFGAWSVNPGGLLSIMSSTNQIVDQINVDAGTFNVALSNIATIVTATNFNVTGGGTANVTSGRLSAFNLNIESGTLNISQSNFTLSVGRLGGGLGETAIINLAAGITLSIQNTLTYTANNDALSDPNGAIIQGLDATISFSTTKTISVADSANADNDLTIEPSITLNSFAKTGAGTLYLLGANASTSGFAMNGGAIKIGNDLALGSATFTVTNGTLLGDGTARTIMNNINVRGTTTIGGSSELTFNQMSSIGSPVIAFYNTAKTTVTNLIVADANQARTLTLRGTGEVDLVMLTVGSGTGNDNVNFDSLEGTGIFNVRGANTYVGITSIRSGEVRVFNEAAFGVSSTVNLGLLGAATRTASLLLDGGLTLTNDLHASATGSGNSSITLGSLTNFSSTFSGNITLSQNVNLFAPATGTTFFTGIIGTGGGNAGLTVTGAGTVVLSGANVYTGPTIIAGGTLQAANAAALGTGSILQVDTGGAFDLNGLSQTVVTLTNGIGGGGTVVNSGAAATFTVGDGSFGGVIAGGANVNVVKNTVGTLALNGVNTYEGTTVVEAGTLVVNGSLASSAGVFVDAAGTLAGSGSIAAVVTSSGTIAPGTSAGTLTIGGLVLNGGFLNFELDTIGASDRIILGGGLAPTVNAPTTLNLSALAGFDVGTYTLMSGYGANTLDASFANLVLASPTLNNLQLNLVDNAGQLDLIVSAVQRLWSGTTTTAWNAVDLNWDAGANAYVNGAIVTFNASVTASNDIAVDAAGVNPHHVIVTNDLASTYTFGGGAVVGTSLTKDGVGLMVLANSNTYANGVTIVDGELRIGNGGTTGELNGDVLNNGLLSFNRSDVYTYAGVISGTGDLHQNGTGTLVLTGDSTFTGDTIINSGFLQVRGNYASPIFNNNPTESTIVSFTTGDITFTSPISGNVSFEQSGDGITTLLGANTYTGETVVNSGTLVVANDLNGTGFVEVNSQGVLQVADGASLTAVGQITVFGTNDVQAVNNQAGIFVADGTINATQVTVGTGGILQGSGTVNAPVFVESGGGLSAGNSVGELTFDDGVLSGGNLTLAGGSTLFFEFREATGLVDLNGADPGGTGAGFAWDMIDLGAGLLDIGDASATNPILVNIDAWLADNSGHDNGSASTNNFDPLQSYDWLFIATTNVNSPAFDVPPDDDFSRRFLIVDDVNGSGVFGTGNAFTRPVSSLGQGTFSVKFGNFGGQGNGLYISYSAIPEPGSMILAGLASLGAGWYGRRRLKKRQAE